MSVRRLAAQQPASFEMSPQTREKAEWWLTKYPAERRQSAVIPLLWLIQKQEGWVSEPSIRFTAEYLGMPVIRVLEVATFYTQFQLEPVGSAALVQVCGTTPCRLRGAESLIALLEQEIGPRDKLSADGLFTWQEVECVGACCNAPVAQINDLYYEDLTPDSLSRILAAFRAGQTPPAGSAIGRRSSEPEGGALTLTDPTLYDGSPAKPLTLPNLPAAEGASA
jgi:NADH-quinone oxidoreductase subunit E